MTEEIRDLIEKINQEGIKAAEEKAQKIEAAAKQRADTILNQAKIEAEKIISDAQERIRREDKKEKALLAQAGRDVLLSLRNEINVMLGRIVLSEVNKTLTPDALFTLLQEVVKKYNEEGSDDIVVLLHKEDLDILEKNFLHKLKEETKKNIILRPKEEISGGLMISYNSETSSYDFTNQALAEYIITFLKPKLNHILQESVKE